MPEMAESGSLLPVLLGGDVSEAWRPMDTAPIGERILTKMKHGAIEGVWDGAVARGYYWLSMEWYPTGWLPVPGGEENEIGKETGWMIAEHGTSGMIQLPVRPGMALESHCGGPLQKLTPRDMPGAWINLPVYGPGATFYRWVRVKAT